MHPMLNIAVRAARKAGDYVVRSFDNRDSIETNLKGTNDHVTNVNLQAEALIIETIKNSYPDHSIIAEESGLSEGKDDAVQWIIDPLDGTNNFVKGFPHLAVSIAVRMNNRLEVACVYDPIRNDLFTAQRGAGAQLNSARIRINQLKDLQGATLATAFPYQQKQFFKSHQDIMSSLSTVCADFRVSGSPALDLCYVAANRIDGYFALGLKPWDMAAGTLIAKEAGAIVTDFTGGANQAKSGNMVVASTKATQAILKHIRENGSDAVLK